MTALYDTLRLKKAHVLREAGRSHGKVVLLDFEIANSGRVPGGTEYEWRRLHHRQTFRSKLGHLRQQKCHRPLQACDAWLH